MELEQYMNRVRFDADGWLHFLTEFDPIQEASFYRLFSNLETEDISAAKVLSLGQELREMNPPSIPPEDDPSPLALNLENIYGGSMEKTWDYINAYQKTREKIIRGYLNINGLEQLFSVYYFHFEWMMHVERKFETGKEGLYRDHFLHQTKNAWMGYEYLYRFGWMKYIFRWIDSHPTNTIVDYVNKSVNKEIQYRLQQDEAREDHPLQQLLEYYRNALDKAKHTNVKKATSFLENYLFMDKPEEYFNKPEKKQIRMLLEIFVRIELVQTTWFISALLHDIGYPVQFVRRQHKELVHFLPTMEWPALADNVNFDQLECLLGNSLLFNIVQECDLRNDYSNDAHGTVSALVMLNHFYRHGTVHGFSPLKQCAIDWAAVCIQQHTQRFQASTGEKKDRYLVDRFEHNALGYLLRMVDDLQEFDRFYFYIGHNHALLFCRICDMPLVANKKLEDTEAEILTSMQFYPRELQRGNNQLAHSAYRELKPTAYHCACTMLATNNENKRKYIVSHKYNPAELFPVEQCCVFPYRRINTLILCRQVTVASAFPDDHSVGEKEPKTRMDVSMLYDSWAMLMMLQIDPNFLCKRIRDINQLKRMLRGQKELPVLTIHYFIHYNPLWLKTDILFHFLLSIESAYWREAQYIQGKPATQKKQSKMKRDEKIQDASSQRVEEKSEENEIPAKEEEYIPVSYEQIAKYLNDMRIKIMEDLLDLLCDVYLGGGQCLMCPMHCDTETQKEKLQYARVKEILKVKCHQWTESMTNHPVLADENCPAVRRVHRVFWRLFFVYVPMLVIYFNIYKAITRELSREKLKEYDAHLNQWYDEQTEKIKNLGGDREINHLVFMFMRDFACHCASLCYAVNETEFHQYSSAYYDQFDQFKKEHEIPRGLKRNDVISYIRTYVDNGTYRPEDYVRFENNAFTNGPAWADIDFFSDLNLFQAANAYYLDSRETEEDKEKFAERMANNGTNASCGKQA